MCSKDSYASGHPLQSPPYAQVKVRVLSVDDGRLQLTCRSGGMSLAHNRENGNCSFAKPKNNITTKDTRTPKETVGTPVTHLNLMAAWGQETIGATF